VEVAERIRWSAVAERIGSTEGRAGIPVKAVARPIPLPGAKRSAGFLRGNEGRLVPRADFEHSSIKLIAHEALLGEAVPPQIPSCETPAIVELVRHTYATSSPAE